MTGKYSDGIVIKTVYVVLLIIIIILIYVLFEVRAFNDWQTYAIALIFFSPLFFKNGKKETSPQFEWKLMNKSQKFFWVAVVTFWVTLISLAIYFGILHPMLAARRTINQDQARAIAETTCIKGGKAIDSGVYEETRHIWIFNSNLNSTRPGCISNCTVNAETKTALLEWNCAGPEQTASEATTCQPAERELKECPIDENPVCATVQIQCIKAPCNPIQQTFSSACEACHNPLVSGYVNGECKK